jgi:hypothetical protein
LAKAKQYSVEIEENILCSMIDPFHYPCSRVEAKTNNSSKNAQDPITLLTQKFD